MIVCPKCNVKTRVYATRQVQNHPADVSSRAAVQVVVRYRKCPVCGKHFKTVEE